MVNWIFRAPEVHLQTLRSLPAVQALLADQRDILANLDQNPNVQEHWGSVLPVLMASLSHMWSLMRDRPLTPQDSFSV